MNNTDFEARLARALNVGVDERLGAERPAPPFRADNPTRTLTRRSGPRWNRTLLVAACIIAVVAGAIALVALRDMGPDRSQPQPPATESADPSPTPSQSLSTAPTPTRSSVTTRNATSSNATTKVTTSAKSSPSVRTSSRTTTTPTPQTTTVLLAGAKIALPQGWAATSIPNASMQSWCLQPAGKPLPANCVIEFTHVTSYSLGQQIDVDNDGGFYGDGPQYCEPAQPTRTGQYGQRTLGGRQAEWRRFVIACPNGQSFQHEQYVVNSQAGYILSTSQAGGQTGQQFAAIAAGSTLPARSTSAPLLLNDHAIVRRVETVSGLVRITVQHSVDKTGAMTLYPGSEESSELNTYTLPARFTSSAKKLKVGDHVVVWTNGTKVSDFFAGVMR